MKQEVTLIRARLKTPRAAAIAGILFAVLLITGLVLFRLSVRADPLEAGAWLNPGFAVSNQKRESEKFLALNTRHLR